MKIRLYNNFAPMILIIISCLYVFVDTVFVAKMDLLVPGILMSIVLLLIGIGFIFKGIAYRAIVAGLFFFLALRILFISGVVISTPDFIYYVLIFVPWLIAALLYFVPIVYRWVKLK